jgi:tuftelin-interacting protein 11
MKEFEINPSNQDVVFLTEFFFPWSEVISEEIISPVFDCFFQQWHEALWVWIKSPEAKLDEISQWFTAWKDFFKNANQYNKSVKNGFKKGLDMINQGLAGANAFVPSSSKEKPKIPLAQLQLTFQDLVEQMAAESDLEFVPLNRVHKETGKPIYRLGNLLSYIDDGIIFVQIDRSFRPVSVEDAIFEAKACIK